MALIVISIQDSPDGPVVALVAEPAESVEVTPAQKIATALLSALGPRPPEGGRIVVPRGN